MTVFEKPEKGSPYWEASLEVETIIGSYVYIAFFFLPKLFEVYSTFLYVSVYWYLWHHLVMRFVQ